MRSIPLLFLFLASGLSSGQDTISVDAVPVMHVCGGKNAALSGPCATAPHAISKSNPTYPEKARQSRTEGTVTLALIVGKDGSTRDVHVINGQSNDLNHAAIDAVNQWKFEPATYEGKPVDVEMTAQVNFRLDSGGTEPQGKSSNNRDQLGNLFTDAEEAYKRGDYQTAANIARRMTQQAPEHPTAWNFLGRSLLALNEFDAAADALLTQIKVNPGSTVAYNNLGLVYWKQHKYEDATAQFHKQILINPNDHYAHGNLGMMLHDQKKCSDAVAELKKGLAISPDKPEPLLALGECDIDLGDRAKGISELEQAIGSSSAPGTRNSAAYALAERNIELDRAEKWSDACLAMESARMSSISLDHLTPQQLNFVTWIAAYWDTRGWIYFLRGDNAKAESYIEPSWHLFSSTTVGDHLAHIYERTGRQEEAVRTYAMAIAAADLPLRFKANEEDLADARERLAKLEPNPAQALQRGITELATLNTIAVPNSSKVSGQGDFTLLLKSATQIQARRISGDSALDKVTPALQTAHVAIRIPQDADLEIPLRGTLTCGPEETQCRFVFFSPDAAVDLARKEMATDVRVADTATDPHLYDNPAMGMRITLPDGWKLMREEPGSFTSPHNVMFGKAGSTALFMLKREHAEASQDLYKKILEAGMGRLGQFERLSETSVTRDGLSGTRWTMTMNKDGITYFAVTEFFSVGDEHYRLTAMAPKEIYDRYAETMANIMQSAKFPMWHADPGVLEGLR